MANETRMSERAREFYSGREESGQPSFGAMIGIEFDVLREDEVVAIVKIGPHLHQPYGIVHGGTWCAIAEEVASVGGSIWLGERGHVVGVNNSTDFLRPRSEGVVTAVGTPVQQGRSQQLWRIEMSGEDGKLIAVSQVRLANLAHDR